MTDSHLNDNPHEGHRARLREQYFRQGLESFSDVQVLEMLLFYCIRRGDTNEIAHGILYLQQPQTHALWREFKMMKGSTSVQVKPVRVLDTPMKKNFF